jgi:hypothetical protein
MSEGMSSNFAESEPPLQPELTLSEVLREALPMLYQEIGIDEETRILKPNLYTLQQEEKLSGGEYGKYLAFSKIIDRSFKNVQESVRSHLDYYLKQQGPTAISALVEDLKTEIAEVKKSFFVEYFEDIPDFETVLEDGQVKPLEQLIRESSSEDEKTKYEQEAGAGTASGNQGYHERRSHVQKELFMLNPIVEVAHAILASAGETLPPNKEAPGSQYGDLCLVLDWNKVRNRTLFTESDALNSTGLSLSLEKNKDKINDVTKRQLIFEHALISKAIYNLDARRNPEATFRKKILPPWEKGTAQLAELDPASIRYIEAQILGGFSLNEVEEIWLKQPNPKLEERIIKQYPHIKVRIEK